MKYATHYLTEEGYVLVTIPDIPEFTAVVYPDANMHSECLDAFELALDFYTESNKPIPLPNTKLKGEGYLEIPTTLAAKVYLYNEWVDSGKSKKELADTIHVKPSNLNRLFDFRYKSKIEAIELALKGLGKSLEIKVA